MEEKISELQKTLELRVEFEFSQLRKSAKNNIDVIVSFLALLELVKQRIVSVEQNKLFEDIKIKKSEISNIG